MEASHGPQRPDVIDLVGVGRLPRGLVVELSARLSARVHTPCRARADEALVPPLLAGRAQGDADALLGLLESRPLSERSLTLGVVGIDLAIPIFTFVFGRARQGGRAAVVSLARLDPAFHGDAENLDLLAHRAVLEMLHELGHVAALAHCPDAACLMSFAASVERLDVRGTEFCSSCATRLPPWLAANRALPVSDPRDGLARPVH